MAIATGFFLFFIRLELSIGMVALSITLVFSLISFSCDVKECAAQGGRDRYHGLGNFAWVEEPPEYSSTSVYQQVTINPSFITRGPSNPSHGPSSFPTK